MDSKSMPQCDTLSEVPTQSERAFDKLSRLPHRISTGTMLAFGSTFTTRSLAQSPAV